MALRNPQLNWDTLLDGGTYTLNLDDIGWQRGLNDLRAKIHYEADRRRGVAHTHKVDAVTLEFHCIGARINRPDPGSTPTPQDQPPTPMHQPYAATVDRSAHDLAPAAAFADDEALLGPCTCGQAPSCQAGCARFLDAVA